MVGFSAFDAKKEFLGPAYSGVPLSLESKRTLGFGCPQEFFRRIGIAQRPEVAPQNRIRDGEVIASKHIEMLVCERRQPSYIFRLHFSTLRTQVASAASM